MFCAILAELLSFPTAIALFLESYAVFLRVYVDQSRLVWHSSFVIPLQNFTDLTCIVLDAHGTLSVTFGVPLAYAFSDHVLMFASLGSLNALATQHICLARPTHQFHPVSYTHLTLPTNREV